MVFCQTPVAISPSPPDNRWHDWPGGGRARRRRRRRIGRDGHVQIRRGAHRSVRQLETAIKAYLDITNQSPRPFVWTKTPDEILASVARFCARTSESGH
jgi:hypothetical protein